MEEELLVCKHCNASFVCLDSAKTCKLCEAVHCDECLNEAGYCAPCGERMGYSKEEAVAV